MDGFARACEEVASNSGRNRKLEILSTYLKTLDTEDLVRAARYFSAQPVDRTRRGLAVGGALLRDAAVAVTGYPVDLVRFCIREAGDTSEAISLMLHGKSAGEPLSMVEAERLYELLDTARRTAEKQRVLELCFQRHRPATVKYFLKVITGNLRIGLQEKLLEEALARSAGLPAEPVRDAVNRCGDIATVARALRQGTLHEIEAQLFHPMDFMLASPLDRLEDLTDAENWWIEDKFDGIRVQAHASHGRVRLFSRGKEDVTESWPDLVLALSQLPGSVILDGELLAWREGRPLAFNVLQQRLARKTVTATMIAEIPAALVAYDLLYLNGRLVGDQPLEARRTLLEEVVGSRPFPLLLSEQWTASAIGEIDVRFQQARERGNEGLLLKRKGSFYEGGKRGGAWLKLKRPFGTLDVVITAAEQGRGRRATVLSDYTFAVRDGERWLNVGKAYSGLTDEEIRSLTRLLRGIATERFGRVTLVRPEVVLEVAFDGIQKSPRHKSGYALRFPRIMRWRKDKTTAEGDTLDRVRSLYEASL